MQITVGGVASSLGRSITVTLSLWMDEPQACSHIRLLLPLCRACSAVDTKKKKITCSKSQ